MKICFPVKEDKGLDSTVHNHFGSAPIFIIFDTESKKTYAVNNGNLNHARGACNPLLAIGGQVVDAVVAGGIGANAIRALNSYGIKVYKATSEKVSENIELLSQNKLSELDIQQACASHKDGCVH